MLSKRLISKGVLAAISILLAISLVLNIAMIIEIRKYKYKVSNEGYNYIEQVKSIHESNEQVLVKAIEIGSINNMDILKLYKNYSNLTKNIANLWGEYIYYEDNRKLVMAKKNIDTQSVTAINVNSNIEEFFSDILEMEMQNPNYKVEFSGDMRDKLNEIYNLEKEKTNYYKTFCDEKLSGAVQDEKKDIIIKKHYWIDILKGYNEIDKKYADYEFKIS